MIIKFISIISLSLIVFSGLTKQRVEPNGVNKYALVENKTLTQLDLRSLEGHWYGVYSKDLKHQNDTCPQAFIVVGEGYVNVTFIHQGNATTVTKFEQNKQLKGKLEEIIKVNGTTIENPSWILQTDPVLVIYDVDLENNVSYFIYSRVKNVTNQVIKQGLYKLIEAGVDVDTKGNYGYHCQD